MGSLSTGMFFIPLLGHNRAFVVTPVCCGLCTFLFCFISKLGFERLKYKTEDGEEKRKNLLFELAEGFWIFAKSMWLGGRLIFTNRDLIWLIPCYGVGSYAHRYLDTGLLPKIAKRYLGHSSWGLIMCSGSSAGELLGSLLIFFTSKWFRTPLFWLRVDALLMLTLWVVPYWHPPPLDITQA